MRHRHVVRLVRHLVEQLLVADHGDQPRLRIPQHQRAVVEAAAAAQSRPGAVDGQRREQTRRRPRQRSSPAARARPVRAARTARSPAARAGTHPTAAPPRRRRRWSARPAATPGRRGAAARPASRWIPARRRRGRRRTPCRRRSPAASNMTSERAGLLGPDAVGHRTTRCQQPFSQCGLARGRHKVNDMVSTMARSHVSGSAHGDRARGRFGHPFPARDQDRAQGAVAGRRHARHRVGGGRGGRGRRRTAGDHHLRRQRRRRRALRRRLGAGRHAGGARQEAPCWPRSAARRR